MPRCVQRAAEMRRVPAVAHRAAASSLCWSPRTGDRPAHAGKGEAAGRWAPPLGRRQTKRPTLSKRARGVQTKKARLWRACTESVKEHEGPCASGASSAVRRIGRAHVPSHKKGPLSAGLVCLMLRVRCCVFGVACSVSKCLLRGSGSCVLVGVAGIRLARPRCQGRSSV